MVAVLEEYKEDLLKLTSLEVVDKYILSGDSFFTTEDDLQFLRRRISVEFGVDESEVTVRIVGSAHLGFAILKKRTVENSTLPMFRNFGPSSDIDVLVASEAIYQIIWDELCGYSHRQRPWPWRSERLGDYHMCGWLRPDHFPPSPTLFRCRTWMNLFSRFSRDDRFGKRQVRGGLFHSIDHARIYYERSIKQCQSDAELLQ